MWEKPSLLIKLIEYIIFYIKMRKRLVKRFNEESVSDSLYGQLHHQTKNQIEDYIDSGKFSYMGIKWTFLKRKPDIALKKDRPVRQSMIEQSMFESSPQSIHEEVENFFSPQPLRCVFPNISSLGLKKQSRRYEHETNSKGSESPQNRNYRTISINEFGKSSHEVKPHLSNILTTDGTMETRNKTPTLSRRSVSRNTLHALAATGDKTPTIKGYLSIFSSEDKKSLSIRDKRCATPDQKRSMTPLALRRGRHKSNVNPFNSLRASATIDPSEVIHSISSDQNREGLNMIGASQTLDLSPTASVDRSNFVPILVYEPEKKSQTKKNLDIRNASLVSTMLRDSTNISLSEKLDVLNQSYDPLNKPDLSDGINPKNGRRFMGRFSAVESDFPLEMFEKWREEDEAKKGQRQGSFKEIQQQPKFLQRPYTKALSKALEKVKIDTDGDDSVQNQRNTTIEYGHSVLKDKYKSYLDELRSKKIALEAAKNKGRSGRNLLKNQKDQQKAKLNFSLDKEKVELNLENIIEKTKMGSYDVPTLTKVLDNMRSRRPHELGSKFLKMTFRPKQMKERGGSKAKSVSVVSKSFAK